MKIEKAITEQRNKASENIDDVSTLEMVKIINEEDKKVALAVEKELKVISEVIEIVSDNIKNGGRLIYIGAGTSGRLGSLDAFECPPTFGVDKDLVQGLVAGGNTAIFEAEEDVEDSEKLGEKDLREINFSKKDVLFGISASGRTPYVVGALKYANGLQAETVSLTSNPNSKMSDVAKHSICPIVGPEVITGSTRMKAGTSHKMVINMVSTGVMVKLGKVYSNLMVDVQTSNSKLVERAINIVVEATSVSEEKAKEVLEMTDNNVKLAILLIKTNLDKEEGKKLLKEHSGYLAKAIESA